VPLRVRLGLHWLVGRPRVTMSFTCAYIYIAPSETQIRLYNGHRHLLGCEGTADTLWKLHCNLRTKFYDRLFSSPRSHQPYIMPDSGIRNAPKRYATLSFRNTTAQQSSHVDKDDRKTELNDSCECRCHACRQAATWPYWQSLCDRRHPVWPCGYGGAARVWPTWRLSLAICRR
jgi:hypothetical protein